MIPVADAATRIARQGAQEATRFHVFGREEKRQAAALEAVDRLDTLHADDGSTPYAPAAALVRAAAHDASALRQALEAVAARTEALAGGGVCALAGLAVTLLPLDPASAATELAVVAPHASGLARTLAELQDVAPERRLGLLAAPLDPTRSPEVARAQHALLLAQPDSPWKAWATTVPDPSARAHAERLALTADPRAWSLPALRNAIASCPSSPAFAAHAIDALAAQARAEAPGVADVMDHLRAHARPSEATLAAVGFLSDASAPRVAEAFTVLARGVDAPKRLPILLDEAAVLGATGLMTFDTAISALPAPVRVAALESGLRNVAVGQAPRIPLTTAADVPLDVSLAYTRAAAAISDDAPTRDLVKTLVDDLPLAYPSERLQAVETAQSGLFSGTPALLAAILPVLSRADDRNGVADHLLGQAPNAVLRAIPTFTGTLPKWPRARATEAIVRTLATRPTVTLGGLAAAAREALPQVRATADVEAYGSGLLDAMQTLSPSPLFTEVINSARDEVARATDRRAVLEHRLRDVEAIWDQGLLRAADPPQGGQVEQQPDAVVIGSIRVPRRAGTPEADVE